MEGEEQSQEYLTVNTHQGLYRYNRLVFGITPAPAIWQRSMDQILEGIEGTSCILDDMIITGKDDEEHLTHLEETLKRLKEHGLRANRETQEKVDAVINAPRPENAQQVCSFLGLVNYYHKFLPNHPQPPKQALRTRQAMEVVRRV